MVAVPTKSHTRIETDRKWHNYETLKAHFSSRKKFKEIIFDGVQTATGALVEVWRHGPYFDDEARPRHARIYYKPE